MTRSGSSRRVLVVQHVPWEAPGRILPALTAAGVDADVRVMLDGGPPVPGLDDLAGVVLMGGPMGADDVGRHPSLAIERDLARRAVEAGIPVLGVCLGHQILALALGGRLDPGATAEVGVAPVELLVPSSLGPAGAWLDVLHWHFDNAVPPPGAEVLANSAGCDNQAFRLGSALGIQFHLEVDVPLLERWLAVDEVRDEAHETTGEQPAAMLARLAAGDVALGRVADAVFGEFAAAAAERA